MKKTSLVGCLVAFALGGATSMPAAAHENKETVTPKLQQAIPNIPGKSLLSVVVDYPPGVASPAHLHAKSAFIYAYVLSGSIESQVDDGPRQTFHAGDSFHEPPGARHSVSRNASKTKPAKLLAVFVVDTGDAPLTTPITTPEPVEKRQ